MTRFFLLPTAVLGLALSARAAVPIPESTPPERQPAALREAAPPAAPVATTGETETTDEQKPAPKAPPPMPKEADFARLPNGDLRIGCVTLHRKERQISFPGKVVMDPSMAPRLELGGVIEVLIARTQFGRLYEAILGTDAQPSHVQVMLILLGLNNGARIPGGAVRQGDLVDIDIEWKKADGTTVLEPVENFLQDKRTKETMKRVGWVFTGTTVQHGVVGADAEGNVALTWSSGSTILDSPDPQADKTDIFVCNPKHPEPKEGTPVRIILTPRKAPAAPPPSAAIQPPPPSRNTPTP